jgi:glycerol-1-phosphate dehydrogenase [NAD(P)+]
MSIEQPSSSSIFRFDPADMDGLRRTLANRPDAASLPTLNLGQVEAGADALLALPTILRSLARVGSSAVLLVQDRRPFWREGIDLKPFVRKQLEQADFQVEVLEMGDQEGYLHSDFAEVEQIRPHLRPDKTAVALGSGKICDVTKHACFEHEQETGQHIPYVVVQTANSVIAFGSGMATITKDGVKRTWPSRLPDALVLDARILRDAPFEYTVGGIGDLSVIAVSFGDWYLGSQLGISKYTPASFDILQDVRALLFSQAAAFASRNLTGMETLAKLSVLGGFSMTLARSSAPMSGYEHAVSHMLDMSAQHYGRAIASHGCQCGISTIACAIAWRKWLSDFQPDQVDVDACFPSAQQMQQRVQATFDAIDRSGAMAAECWNTYSRKLEGWHRARPQFEAFLRDWPQQRTRLTELVHPPETVVDGLALAQHPLRYEDLGIPEQQARWAFKNGHMMRQRFSSADLLNYVGLLDDAFVDDVFTQMRTLVAQQTHAV